MSGFFGRRPEPERMPKSVPGSGPTFRAHQVELPEPSSFNARRVAERESFNRRSQYWLIAMGLAALLLAAAIVRRGALADASPLAAVAQLASTVDLGPLNDAVADWAVRVAPLPPTATPHAMPESGQAMPLGTPAGALARSVGRPGGSPVTTIGGLASGGITATGGTEALTASQRPAVMSAGRLEVSGDKRPLMPGVVRQLLTDGCCAKAWWASDSSGLEYIDRPPTAPGPAIYRIALWPPASEPEALDLQVSERAASNRFTVRVEGQKSIIRDLASDQEWQLGTGGNPLKLSESGSWAVWWDAPGGRAHFDTEVKIRASRLEGTEQRELVGLWAGEVVGFYDDQHVVVTGRLAKDTTDYGVWAVDVLAGNARLLANGSWLAGLALSPDRRWLVYTISLNRGDPAANGIWAVGTAEGATPRKLAFEGAYRWRDGSRLVYVPFEPGVAVHGLWQLDLNGGEPVRLFDPDAAHVRIANNDWSISPDGATLAFLAAEDHNLWAVDLP